MGLRDLCLSSINHGILAKEAAQSSYTKYFMYVYSHMKVYVTDKSLCKDEYILAHMVGEEYAAFLPKQMKIEDESAAKLHFASVVRGTLKSVKASNPDFTVCFPHGLTYGSYERDQEFKIGYNERSEFKKYPDPFKNPADFRAKVSLLLEFNNKKADVGALFDVAYDIVLMLALMMIPVRVNLPKEVTFLTFVTFAKKGLVSEEYIKKVETVIQEELQLNIKLNENQIKKLWKYCEPHMNAELMQHCVKSTLAELSEESVRLRKLVELCKWQGLTCYQAVKQALDLSDFRWDSLIKLTAYQTEMKAYEEAAQLVGDNAFYGYNPSMGKAKSIHYKNLASVCARILVETRKSPALDKAACFNKSYPSKSTVDAIIAEYVRQCKSASSSKPKPVQSKGAGSTSLDSKPRKEDSKATETSNPADATKHVPCGQPSGVKTSTTISKSKTSLRKSKTLITSRKPDSGNEPSWPDDVSFDNDFDDGVNSWPDMGFDDPYDASDRILELVEDIQQDTLDYSDLWDNDPLDSTDLYEDRILELCNDIEHDTLDYSDLWDNDPLDSTDYCDRFDDDLHDGPDYFDQCDDFGYGDSD